VVLAFYCSGGSKMRTVDASTVVWIVARGAFWIGYHRGSQYCVVGLTGTVQSQIIPLYICARFGFDIAGPVGAIMSLVLFAGIELWLVRAAWSPSR
jgi:hypothetical protein